MTKRETESLQASREKYPIDINSDNVQYCITRAQQDAYIEGWRDADKHPIEHNVSAKTQKGVYYISNTCDEWGSSISGYFATKEDAIKALAECQDWYRTKGTGRIYFQPFGVGKNPKLVYEVR